MKIFGWVGLAVLTLASCPADVACVSTTAPGDLSWSSWAMIVGDPVAATDAERVLLAKKTDLDVFDWLVLESQHPQPPESFPVYSFGAGTQY